MTLIEKLLPPQASNDYRGSPIAFYAFILLSIVMCGRSLIHFLKDDSGVHSIATIIVFPGDPDPNQVIHMFSSLWGTQQLIMVFIYFIVIVRYRNLVLLMFLLMIVEIFFRWTVGTLHPLTDEFYLRTPPGKIGNLPLLVISAVMLVLSLRTRPERVSAPD